MNKNMSEASKDSYRSSFTADATPKEAFERISRPLEWWSKTFEGSSSKLGDVFTVRFQNGDWYKIQIDEVVPDKKIVWSVLDADQTWHEDRKEWVGTKIIWEISPAENGSEISMIHLGLIPEFECYKKCKLGWDYLTQKSLLKLLNDDEGLPV